MADNQSVERLKRQLRPMNTDGATPEQIFIATILRRHEALQDKLTVLGPRTQDNAPAFDEVSAQELAFHNAIETAFENSELDATECHRIADIKTTETIDG